MGADFQMNTNLSPGIQAMLPLLYAAWADRHLNLKEINALRKRANGLAFLTDADKEILLNWTDPVRPPERELFQQHQSSRSLRGHVDQPAIFEALIKNALALRWLIGKRRWFIGRGCLAGRPFKRRLQQDIMVVQLFNQATANQSVEAIDNSSHL